MLKLCHASAIFLFCPLLALLTACKNAQQPPESELLAYPGYTGIYEGFTLVLDDRFNDAYWQKGDGAVGGESMYRFQDQGVQVVDGILELVIREELVKGSWSEDHQQMKGDYDYSGGEIRTRPDKKIRYGRVETRMRAPTRASASGYISSLFTYVNQYDPEAVASEIEMEWEEIDIELEGGRPDKFQANLIYGINTREWWRTRDYGAWEDKIVVGLSMNGGCSPLTGCPIALAGMLMASGLKRFTNPISIACQSVSSRKNIRPLSRIIMPI